MYNEFHLDNNITYSIDMIRLKTYISYFDFSTLEFRFDTCWSNFVNKKYFSSKYSDFKYNYVIEVGEGVSFWFGFYHNSEKVNTSNENVYNLTIEFNPNKVKHNKILSYLLNLSSNWYLKSFDLALDLRINILDIIGYDKGRKKELKVISARF